MTNNLTRDIYYRCGHKIFRNKLQALYESMISGQFPKFYYADDVFGSMDWSVPILDSVHTLIGKRALQLREKYDYLVVCWSGGTDSHTMYQGFINCKVHIDEIVVAYTSQGDDLSLQASPKCAVDWIKKNHPDPTTRITVVDRTDKIHHTYYDTEYWATEKWTNGISRFEATIDKESFYADTLTRVKGKKYAFVHGLEKPCVRLENNKWYAYFLDCSNFDIPMSRADIEPFFATPDFPELQIKQAQLLKRNTQIRLAARKIKSPDWDSRQDLDSKNPLFTYSEHATACGLIDELIAHASLSGKLSTKQYWQSLQLDRINNNKLFKTLRNAQLADSLTDNSVYASNYIKGINAVFTDRKFLDWLISNNWIRQDSNLSQLTGMMSNWFYLGDQHSV